MKEFSTYKTVGQRMGKKIQKQKKTFCGKMNGPKSPEEILHVVDLKNLTNIDKKLAIIDGVLESFKDNNVSADDIIFFNDKD